MPGACAFDVLVARRRSCCSHQRPRRKAGAGDDGDGVVSAATIAPRPFSSSGLGAAGARKRFAFDDAEQIVFLPMTSIFLLEQGEYQLSTVQKDRDRLPSLS